MFSKKDRPSCSRSNRRSGRGLVASRIFGLIGLLIPWLCSGADFVVTDYGANPDGTTLSTTALQKAIDACAENGGGRVVIPPGKFLTGTLWLRDNVDFHLQPGSTILGTTDNPARYTDALLLLDKVTNVTISGDGTINGQGWHQNFNNRGREIKVSRPEMIFVRESKHIKITGIKLRDAARWIIRLKKSEWITIDNINIYSHSNTNNDGIDIDASNVVISNSIIDCDDDAICFKSYTPGFIVENVSISNCRIASNCNAIKFGTWSAVGFRNISISNCVITSAAEDNVRTPKWYERMEGITRQPTVISGLALEVVDGGFMDQVTITNVSMQGVQTPIFIRLGNREGIGSLSNVIISNIIATNESRITSSITGIKDAFVENVLIKDVIFQSKGTATLEHARKPVPEKDGGYPENRMYGDSLPAHGFYVRHAKGIHLENLRLKLRNPDARPAIVFENVHDSSLRNIQADPPTDGQPLFRLTESTNIRLSDYQSIESIDTLLSIEGKDSEKIVLQGNDLLFVDRIFALSKGAKRESLILQGNIIPPQSP